MRAALAVALTVTGAAGCGSARVPDAPAGPATPVRVDGNRLVDAGGRTVVLRGFNHAGAEYACVEGDGVFDTPDGGPPSGAAVAAMRRWRGATVVRVPLNEQCWLGVGSVPAAHAGAAYRTAVRTFVDRLTAHGLVAVLDLHRSAPADGAPREQEPMPDRDHSPAFWRSVATEFRADPVVAKLIPVLDLGACSLQVTAGHTDEVSAWYKSDVQVFFTVYRQDTAGAWSYWTQSPPFPAAAAYTTAQFQTPVVPAGTRP
jgi:hypothetical protein